MSESAEKGDLEPKSSIKERARFYTENPSQLTVEFTRECLGFLNNFYMQFPKPVEFGVSYYRKCSQNIGCMQKMNRDCVDNIEGHSAGYLDQTNEKFYVTLDRVVHEVAPGYDELYRKAVEQIGEEDEWRTVPMALRDIYVEVYKKMRALGYTHKELTA